MFEEKHLVCDDFNKARKVLEGLALKVEAFPVDVRRETIRLSKKLCDTALDLVLSTNPQLKVPTQKRPTSFQMQHHHCGR